MAPIIDAYTSEGFDFIALRLRPRARACRPMQPVRVVTQGGEPELPLRMVAAGTGPNVDITLFIIGEGRWEAQNFPNGTVLAPNLTWDFTTMSSNYATARQTLLETHGGRTWNNAYAAQGVLLEPDGMGGQITVGGQTFSTVADAYVQKGVNNGETTDTSCLSWLDSVGNSTELRRALAWG